MSKRTNSRDKLLEAGTSLFMKYGVRKTSVEEICRKADLSKMTFYKYFRNKNELVAAIRERLLDKGFHQFDQINKRELPFAEKVELMSRWRMEFLSPFNRDFLEEVIRIESLNDLYRDKFLKNMREAQNKGEIRSDIKVELLWLVSEKMREISREGMWKEFFDDYATYQDQIRTIFFKGVLV